MQLAIALSLSLALHGALALALLNFTSRAKPVTVSDPVSLGDPGIQRPAAKAAARTSVAPVPFSVAAAESPASVATPAVTPAAIRNAYAARIVAALQERQNYPALARSRSEEGLVEIALTVARDGALIDAQVVRSSDSTTLDAAALALVRALPQDLMALPPEITEAPLKLSVPLRYRLQ